MNLKDIEKIVKIMDDHQLTQFKLEQDDTKLELKKGGDIDIEAVQKLMAVQPAAPMAVQQQPVTPAVAQTGPAAASDALPVGVVEIKSPTPGTFYTSPNPESPAFVSVGDKVKADKVVCIIEAMKVMNELQAEVSGEIIEIVAENGTPVQYGDPLFRVKTS